MTVTELRQALEKLEAEGHGQKPAMVYGGEEIGFGFCEVFEALERDDGAGCRIVALA